MEVNEDDINIYVGCVMHNGRRLLAKIPANEKIAYVMIDGKIVTKHEFEVLCAQRIQWIPMSFESQSLMAEVYRIGNMENSIFEDNDAPQRKRQCYGLDWNIVEYVESVSSTDGTHFLSLNDDCLAEIGAKLCSTDLFAYAKTCTRLYDAARAAFKLNPANAHLNVSEIRKQSNRNIVYYLESYLKIFGDFIKEVVFYKKEDRYKHRFSRRSFKQNSSIIRLIVKHCGPTLEILQMKNTVLSLPTFNRGRALFSNLRMLQLDNVYVLPDNLTTFHIRASEPLGNVFKREPFHRNNLTDVLQKLIATDTLKMETLELINGSIYDDFIHEIGIYPNLKALTLLQMEATFDEDNDLSALNRLMRLEELTLDIKFKYDIKSSAALLAAIGGTESMQRLYLGKTNAETVNVARRFTNLRSLELRYFPELAACLDQCGITELTLDSWTKIDNGINFMRLFQALENLSVLKLLSSDTYHLYEFDIDHQLILDMTTFNNLADLYRERHQKLLIECANMNELTSLSFHAQSLRATEIELKHNDELISRNFRNGRVDELLNVFGMGHNRLYGVYDIDGHDHYLSSSDNSSDSSDSDGIMSDDYDIYNNRVEVF